MTTSNDALLDKMFPGDATAAAAAAPVETDTTSEETGAEPGSEEQTTSPKTDDGDTKAGDKSPAGDEKAPPADEKTKDETGEGTSEAKTEAKSEPKTETETDEEGDKAKTAEETGGEDEGQSREVEGRIQAVQAIRKERNDWKAKANRAEGENAELRRRLDSLEARPVAGEKKPDDAGEEENQTSAEYYIDPVKNNGELVRKIIKEEREIATKQERLDLADRSAVAARKKYKDYDDVEASFLTEMEANPYLLGSLQKHGAKDPSEWLYDFMKNTLPALGGDATSEKKAAPAVDTEALRKEIREEIEKEKRGEAAATAAAGMPKSQVGALSSGAKPRRLPSNSEQLANRMFPDQR